MVAGLGALILPVISANYVLWVQAEGKNRGREVVGEGRLRRRKPMRASSWRLLEASLSFPKGVKMPAMGTEEQKN